jgi:hypothetical protein
MEWKEVAMNQEKSSLDQTVDECRATIAARRQFADELVADIGTPEARRKAKGLRISMTKWERWIDRVIEWVAECESHQHQHTPGVFCLPFPRIR